MAAACPAIRGRIRVSFWIGGISFDWALSSALCWNRIGNWEWPCESLSDILIFFVPLHLYLPHDRRGPRCFPSSPSSSSSSSSPSSSSSSSSSSPSSSSSSSPSSPSSPLPPSCTSSSSTSFYRVFVIFCVSSWLSSTIHLPYLTYPPICQPAYLPTNSPASILSYLPIHQPTYLLAHLSIHLPTYQPPYLHPYPIYILHKSIHLDSHKTDHFSALSK